MNLLPDIHGSFSDIAQLFPKDEVVRLLEHDSMRVYYQTRLTETDFSLSELPTTTARAEIILPVLNTLIERFGKEIAVLDLACSPGYFMFKTAQLGVKDVVGVDARADHMKQFTLLNSFYRRENIHFVHSDIYDFLKKTEEAALLYDVCFLFGFLYHTSDPVQLLRSIRRICRNALLIDTTLSYRFGTTLTQFEEEVSWSRASTTKLSVMPSLRAVPQMLEAAGYKRIERVVPSPSLMPLHPGGESVDYFFDHVGHGLQFFLPIKQFVRGLRRVLHIKTPAPRAVFLAHV